MIFDPEQAGVAVAEWDPETAGQPATEALPFDPETAGQPVSVAGAGSYPAVREGSTPSPATFDPETAGAPAEEWDPEAAGLPVAPQGGASVQAGAGNGQGAPIPFVAPSVDELARAEEAQRVKPGELDVLDYRAAHGAPTFAGQAVRSAVRRAGELAIGAGVGLNRAEMAFQTALAKRINRIAGFTDSVPEQVLNEGRLKVSDLPELSAEGKWGKLLGRTAADVVPLLLMPAAGAESVPALMLRSGATMAGQDLAVQAAEQGLNPDQPFDPLRMLAATVGGAVAPAAGKAVAGAVTEKLGVKVAANAFLKEQLAGAAQNALAKVVGEAAAVPVEGAAFAAPALVAQAVKSGELPTLKDVGEQLLEGVVTMAAMKAVSMVSQAAGGVRDARTAAGLEDVNNWRPVLEGMGAKVQELEKGMFSAKLPDGRVVVFQQVRTAADLQGNLLESTAASSAQGKADVDAALERAGGDRTAARAEIAKKYGADAMTSQDVEVTDSNGHTFKASSLVQILDGARHGSLNHEDLHMLQQLTGVQIANEEAAAYVLQHAAEHPVKTFLGDLLASAGVRARARAAATELRDTLRGMVRQGLRDPALARLQAAFEHGEPVDAETAALFKAKMPAGWDDYGGVWMPMTLAQRSVAAGDREQITAVQPPGEVRMGVPATETAPGPASPGATPGQGPGSAVASAEGGGADPFAMDESGAGKLSVRPLAEMERDRQYLAAVEEMRRRANQDGFTIGPMFHATEGGGGKPFAEFLPESHFATSQQQAAKVMQAKQRAAGIRGYVPKDFYEVFLKITNPKRVADVGGGAGEWAAEIKKAKAAGFDGLVYRNKFEGGGDSYVAFKPEQVRTVRAGPESTFAQGAPSPRPPEARPTAPAVTPEQDRAYLAAVEKGDTATAVRRDDTGRVIPLSERFNPESPDIRLSVRPIKEIEEMRRLSERLANDPRYRAVSTTILGSPEVWKDGRQNLKDLTDRVAKMTPAEREQHWAIADKLGAMDAESTLTGVVMAHDFAQAYADGDLVRAKDLALRAGKTATTQARMLRQLALFHQGPEASVFAVETQHEAAYQTGLRPEDRTRLLELAKAEAESRQRIEAAQEALRANPTTEQYNVLVQATDRNRTAMTRYIKEVGTVLPPSAANTLLSAMRGGVMTTVTGSVNVWGNASVVPALLLRDAVGSAFDMVNTMFQSKRSGKPVSRALLNPLPDLPGATAAAAGTLLPNLAKAWRAETPGARWRALMPEVLQTLTTGIEPRMLVGGEQWAGRIAQPLNALLRQFRGGLSPKERANLALETALAWPLLQLRVVQAADVPFDQASRAYGANQLARIKGLSGWQARAFKLHPDAASEPLIMQIANEYTFKEDGAVSRAFVKFSNLGAKEHPWANLLVRPFMLFARVPGNLLHQMVRWSTPLSAVEMMNAMHQAASAKSDSEAFMWRRAAAQRFGDLAIAGAAWTAGMWLLKNNLVNATSTEMTDREREMFGVSGIPAGHVDVSGLERSMKGEDGAWQPGDKTRSLLALGPVGAIWDGMANGDLSLRHTAAKEGQPYKFSDVKTSDMMFAEGANLINSYLDMTFARGAQQVLQALKQEDFGKIAGNMLRVYSSVVVPNQANLIARSNLKSQPNLKIPAEDITPTAKFMGSLQEALTDFEYRVWATKQGVKAAAGLEFWPDRAPGLPAKLDFLGREIPMTPPGANAGWFHLWDATKAQQIRGDVLPNLVQQVYRATGSQDVLPPVPTSRVRFYKFDARGNPAIDGAGRPVMETGILSAPQREAYWRVFGTAAETMLTKTTSTLQRIKSPDVQGEMLQTIWRVAQVKAQLNFKAELLRRRSETSGRTPGRPPPPI